MESSYSSWCLPKYLGRIVKRVIKYKRGCTGNQCFISMMVVPNCPGSICSIHTGFQRYYGKITERFCSEWVCWNLFSHLYSFLPKSVHEMNTLAKKKKEKKVIITMIIVAYNSISVLLLHKTISNAKTMIFNKWNHW